MKRQRVNWSRNELLAAFHLYIRTPFGRMHSRNPDVIALAALLGRSASAVAMKLVNFASLDPVERRRKVAGLTNVSRSDRDLWHEFAVNSEMVAFESEQASSRLQFESDGHVGEKEIELGELDVPGGPTETERTVRARLVQRFFRLAVLTSYGHQCSFCGLGVPELLTGSHIIPWSQSIPRRADPRNGLCLCALHDRAFDRGLLSVDERLRIMLSKAVRKGDGSAMFDVALRNIEDQAISLPVRFQPDDDALKYHRENVFKG